MYAILCLWLQIKLPVQEITGISHNHVRHRARAVPEQWSPSVLWSWCRRSWGTTPGPGGSGADTQWNNVLSGIHAQQMYRKKGTHTWYTLSTGCRNARCNQKTHFLANSHKPLNKLFLREISDDRKYVPTIRQTKCTTNTTFTYLNIVSEPEALWVCVLHCKHYCRGGWERGPLIHYTSTHTGQHGISFSL